MSNSSGARHDTTQQNHGSASSYINATTTPSLEYHPGASMEWTPQEQAILEEGLVKYASEPVINRYAKIALLLENKTIRDVALRCTWMRKKENSKKRKEDLSLARRNKEIKVAMDKVIGATATPSYMAMQQGFAPGGQGRATNENDVGIAYNGVSGPVRHLLQQNARAFDQISMNIATHQIHENIGLLCQTRDNIYKILNSLDDMPDTKQLPPLQIKVDEELAEFILPPSTVQMTR